MPEKTLAVWGPEATNYPKSFIHNLAEQIAEQLGFEPGNDIFQLVKDKMDGNIFHRDFWDLTETNDGSIEVSDSGIINISLPSYVSDSRNRFTIAHELGHYFLHYLPKMSDKNNMVFKATRYTEGRDNRSEWEANWFSAAFLMPSEAFKEKLENNDGDIDIVAEYFKVSQAAARYHKEYLESI